MRIIVCVLCLLLTLAAPLRAADRLDTVPRVAVVSAFEPEWKVLKASLADAKSHSANGVEFVTGTLAGRKVVLFLSGISMVNAAMNMQLALDRFDVTGIIVSGIAGGVDPNLHVGDVAVAARWGQYLEAVFAREVDGKFQLPPWAKAPFPNYGMIFPGDIGVRTAKGAERRFWFDADAGMLAAASKIGAIDLKRCTVEQACLPVRPLEAIVLLHRHAGHPAALGGQRVARPRQLFLLDQQSLARRLPLLRRHDRRHVHRGPSSFR